MNCGKGYNGKTLFFCEECRDELDVIEIKGKVLKAFVKALDNHFGNKGQCSCIRYEDNEIQVWVDGEKELWLDLKKQKVFVDY